jgi:hypothetical protein
MVTVVVIAFSLSCSDSSTVLGNMKLLFRISRFLLHVPNDTGLFLISILEALNVVSIFETERFSSVLTIDFVSIFGAEKLFSVLTIDVVSVCGTEGFSSVLTLDIVSVFGRERFSSVLTLDIVSVFDIMDVN